MSKTPNKYFQLVHDNESTTADLYIFGDICAYPWESQGEQSGVSIVRQLKELDVDEIKVHINSYGGDVAEGLAIYNVLREHKAQIVTICDGFACSAASVVFMAGDKRVMQPASLLMIHNAWTIAMGNAEELRKTADDIEIITQASVEAYKMVATIDEKKINDEDDEDDDEPKQSAFGVIMRKLTEPAAVLESREIEINIDVDKLAKELTEVLMKGTETPEQPEPKKTGWAEYFERRTK